MNPLPAQVAPPRRDIGFAAEVALGFTCGMRGVALLARRPRWWLLASAPAIVGGVLTVALFYGGFAGLRGWTAGLLSLPDAGGWKTASDVVQFLLAAVAGLLFLLFAFAPLVRAIASPFLALLAERVVADVSGAPAPVGTGSRFDRLVVRPIVESVLLLLVRIVWSAVALPLLCVPVAGAFLFAMVLMPLEGFDLVDLALGARGTDLSQRVSFAKRHPGATIGLGMAKTLLLFVPCLNLAFLPGALVGCVLLDQQLGDGFPVRRSVAT
ncbi:MAG: EI24 domain-containing protein [Planctomycetes bacterium]|nr:EI24 domain-containing protein [Planctomycetota bacterium]